MKKIDLYKLLFILVSVMFFGCSEENDLEELSKQVPQDELARVPGDSFKFEFRSVDIPDKKDGMSTRSIGDNKLEVLGYGFDSFDGLLDSQEGVRSQVIDMERIEQGAGIDPTTGKPLSFSSDAIEKGYLKGDMVHEETYGDSFDQFIDKLTLGASLDFSWIPIFGFKFAFDYKRNEMRSDRFSYHQLEVYKPISRYYFKNQAGTYLRFFLTDDFKESIKRMTGEEIINSYGTHILTDITLGGKLSLMASAKEVYKGKNTVSMFIAKLFNSIKLGIEIDKSSLDYLNELHVRMVQYGGSEMAFSGNPMIEDGEILNDSLFFNYTNFVNSINLETATLIKSNTATAVPIVDVIADPAIRAKVIKAMYLRSLKIDSKNGKKPIHIFYLDERSDVDERFMAQYSASPLAPFCEVYSNLDKNGNVAKFVSHCDLGFIFPHIVDPSLDKSFVIEDYTITTNDITGKVTVCARKINRFLCVDRKFRTKEEDVENLRFWSPIYKYPTEGDYKAKYGYTP